MVDLYKCAVLVLSENGIEGTFTMHQREQDPSIPWSLLPQVVSIIFFDSKHQFIYELKGGDTVFVHQINHMYLKAVAMEMLIATENNAARHKQLSIDIEQLNT